MIVVMTLKLLESQVLDLWRGRRSGWKMPERTVPKPLVTRRRVPGATLPGEGEQKRIHNRHLDYDKPHEG